MKKIPTLFKREFENHNVKKVLEDVMPGMECVLKDECVPTIKWDGSCCAVINGKFYKRYDAKRGKTPPEGAIPCCEPDETTGHWPHWVLVDENNPSDRWFVKAFKNVFEELPHECAKVVKNGTFEAVGPHFQSNPYRLNEDTLVRHGMHEIENLNLSYKSIKNYLENTEIEGIVFWKDNAPLCKIKRTDFGFEWPIKR